MVHLACWPGTDASSGLNWTTAPRPGWFNPRGAGTTGRPSPGSSRTAPGGVGEAPDFERARDHPTTRRDERDLWDDRLRVRPRGLDQRGTQKGKMRPPSHYRMNRPPPSATRPPLPQNGAGDGNRTHVASLEGWSSTIELHPQQPQPSVGPPPVNAPFRTHRLPDARGMSRSADVLVRRWGGSAATGGTVPSRSAPRGHR